MPHLSRDPSGIRPSQHRRTPVLGDDVYGNKDWNRRLEQSTGMTRPLLHAHSLEFTHPGTGEQLSLVAPLPADIEGVVRRIYPQVFTSLSGMFFCSCQCMILTNQSEMFVIAGWSLCLYKTSCTSLLEDMFSIKFSRRSRRGGLQC